MLDTHARKYISPLIAVVGDALIKLKLSPNNVTMIAFILGLSTGILVYFGYGIIGIIALWISGLLDAVDGYIARKENSSSAFGTLLDITSDRVVELSIVISLAFRFPDTRLSLLLLVCSIVLSMTVFLTVGALSENSGEKSFYYQAGVMERTEGFIFFTMMILLTNYISVIASLFATLVLITAVQRFLEGKRVLD